MNFFRTSSAEANCFVFGLRQFVPILGAFKREFKGTILDFFFHGEQIQWPGVKLESNRNKC